MPPADVDLSPDAPFARWVEGQRWFPGTRVPRLAVAGHLALDPAGEVRTLLLHDRTAGAEALYQVPVVEHPAGEPGAILDGPHVSLTDGPRDRAYVDALVALLLGDGTAEGDGTSAAGERVLWEGPAPRVTAARVLSGEQSNTSIIFRPEGAEPVICKLFRQVNAGVNPDVELQSALAAGGATFVPAAIGEVRGTWSAASGETVTGSLAFAQEFFEGVEDAWRVALQAATAADDFSEPARALGESVARMHVALAQTFPTVAPDAGVRSAVAAAWSRRLGIAVAEIPALAPFVQRIQEVYAEAAAAPWPPLQRVHGDLHLGQVLYTPSNGWVLLDFEGEPLRPISERRSPDLAVRDVAGMLRSFDYVSGAVADDDGAAVRAWVIAAQQAFLRGYAETVGPEQTAPDALLAACELDKAVYEAIYETRNRPDWIGIPLAAIGRLAPLKD